MRIPPIGLPTIPEIPVKLNQMTPEQANIHQIESNISPVVSLDAARLERIVRSARVAEAMNFPVEIHNNLPPPSQAVVGSCRKIVRNVAILAGALAIPSILVPMIIGAIGLIIPISLAAMFVGGVMLTRNENSQQNNDEYIGP